MEPLVMTYRTTRLRVGEVECDPMDLGGGSRNIPNWAVQGGGSGDRTIPLAKVPERLAPGGPTTLVCTVEIVISKPDDSWRPRDILARFSTDCSATVNIPPGLVPVRLIHDEAVRKELEKELRVRPLEVRINDPNEPNYRQFKWILTIDGPTAPLNVSYGVQLRSGPDMLWQIGEFICAKGERIDYEVTKERMAGRPGEQFDLILTPSTAAAARHGLPESRATQSSFMAYESSSELNDLDGCGQHLRPEEIAGLWHEQGEMFAYREQRSRKLLIQSPDVAAWVSKAVKGVQGGSQPLNNGCDTGRLLGNSAFLSPASDNCG